MILKFNIKEFRLGVLAVSLVLLSVNIALSQSESVQVAWHSVSIVNEAGITISVPSCNNASNNASDKYLPFIHLSKSGRVDQVILRNEKYEPLSSDEQKNIDVNFLTSVKPWAVIHAMHRGRPVSDISIAALRVSSSGGVEKLISFDFTVTFNNLPAARVERQASFAASSVLSTGQWYKVGVVKSGIFKIDNTFLQQIGVNTASVDPRTLRIYGNGGRMLPQANSAFRYDDLQENAIWVRGESDGTFDNGDYLLFNAKGPNNLLPDTVNNIFTHEKNLYSDTAFYFLTFGQGAGLRLATSFSEPGGESISIGDNAFFQEDDLVNLAHSGREWFGTSIDNQTTKSFNFTIADIVPGTVMPVSIGVAAAFRSTKSISFNFTLNNTSLGSLSLSGRGERITDPVGNGGVFSRSPNSSVLENGSTFRFGIQFNGNGNAGAIGYLNYIRVNYKHNLNLPASQQLTFQSFSAKEFGNVTYIITNASATTRVWDITNPLLPIEMGISLSGGVASVNSKADKFRQFVVFGENGFSVPFYKGTIGNQDLHALIPTVPSLTSAANRLADFRRGQGISTTVVTTPLIYNEFSSGAQDITAIRDFAKMLFNRSVASDSLKYILLFGAASYDYKNRIPNNTNLVPVYESRESFSITGSFSSDDYVGLLDNNEGFWDEPNSSDMLDLGVGRIPVKNIQEADAVVAKLINYASNKSNLGKWRNKVTFVADDDDAALHSKDADTLANRLNYRYPVFNTEKLYLDFYVQEATAIGQRSPDLNRNLDDAVNSGTLIMNYTGHGREVGWAAESILSMDQIAAWSNPNNLPFFVTATCDFGRYDDPAIYSGAMSVLLTPNTAGIGAISTTRVVYASTNLIINKAFYDFVFERRGGQWPLMGDVIMNAKNKNSMNTGVNNRNFTLLGDPTFVLAYAQNSLVLTDYNKQPIVSGKDTVSALQKVTFDGEVRSVNGTLLSDFNGLVSITYFDKPVGVTTRGDEAPPTYRTYQVQKNFIFEGKASVKNGKFSFSFVVPKDISYQYGFGKISLYASQEGAMIDAGGANDKIILGGTAKNAAKDNTPPLVKIFMNDSSFVFGGVTGNPARLIVNLSDENGINVAGTGIGHEITAILNNNSQKPIVLNQFYSSEKDNYTKGVVSYRMTDLPQGRNSLRVKAWDTYNNSGEGYIEFIVANTESVALDHVLNYPNPFSQNTTFHFDHNRQGDDLEVMVQIFTVSGILVKTINTFYPGAKSHIGDIHWNARDDFGDKIGNGVYIYKVSVRSERDGDKAFQFQKLVLLN